jgi:hypothetical protein
MSHPADAAVGIGTAFSGKYKSLFLANQGSKQERLEALMDAIAEVAEAIELRRFPKVRGYECEKCEFAAACYQTPGWERLYQPTGVKIEG